MLLAAARRQPIEVIVRSSDEAVQAGGNEHGCFHELSPTSPPANQPREHPVQRGCEGLFGPGIVGRWAAGDDPSQPSLLHEIAHRESARQQSQPCVPGPEDPAPPPGGAPTGPPGARPASPPSPRRWHEMRCTWSAMSAPPSTHTALTSGFPAGVWSRWFATRTVSMLSRLAERNTSSLTSLGAASASIQILRAGPRRHPA